MPKILGGKNFEAMPSIKAAPCQAASRKRTCQQSLEMPKDRMRKWQKKNTPSFQKGIFWNGAHEIDWVLVFVWISQFKILQINEGLCFSLKIPRKKMSSNPRNSAKKDPRNSAKHFKMYPLLKNKENTDFPWFFSPGVAGMFPRVPFLGATGYLNIFSYVKLINLRIYLN